MGAANTDNFTDGQNRLAALAKALAHPARIAIVDYLLATNTCVCSDIGNDVPLAQPAISHHLKELKNAGIIQGTIGGKEICYCLNEKTIHELQMYFLDIATHLWKRKKIC